MGVRPSLVCEARVRGASGAFHLRGGHADRACLTTLSWVPAPRREPGVDYPGRRWSSVADAGGVRFATWTAPAA